MSFDERSLAEQSDDFINITPITDDECSERLEQMRNSADAIALEAFAGAESLKAAVEKLPALLTNVSDFIKNRFSKDSNVRGIHKPPSILKMSKSNNYLVYSKMRVFKSVGQKAKMMELVTVLEEAFYSVVLPSFKTELPAADVQLAKLATNPNELKSYRFDGFIPKRTMSSYEESVKKIGACFDGKDTSHEAMFGDIYDRNADFEAVIDMVSKLNEETYKLNINDVLGLTERLNGSFSSIVRGIESNEPGYEVSPVVVKHIADVCFQIASLLEFYTVYLFKLRECSTAVKDTVDCLKGV